MRYKKQFITCLFIVFVSQAFAQEYYKAAGLRGGVSAGVTYKKFMNPEKAMEALLSFREGGIQLTAIRQYHDLSLIEVSDDIYFVKGYGGHVGFVYTDEFRFLTWQSTYPNRKISPVIGFDAYLGLEYRVDNFPLIGGIDYKPFFEFSLRNPFRMNISDFAFFIKYSF